MKIKEAQFTRLIPNNGQLYGEVKVLPQGEKDAFLAWFAPEGNSGFELKKLIRKEENLELDWYDNDLHHAFEDVTDSHFAGSDERVEFAQEILADEAVREQMRKRFDEQRDAYGLTENDK